MILPTIPKTIMRLVMLTAILSALGVTAKFIHNSGYEKAKLEYSQALSEELTATLNKARAEWQIEAKKAVEAAREERKVVTRTIEVIKEVNNANLECDDVGNDALRLFNIPINKED